MEHQDEAVRSMKQDDGVERVLLRISHLFLIGSLGLLPLIFFPLPYAPLEYTKTFVVLISIVLSILFYSLSVLRSGAVEIRFPLPLVGFGVITLVSVVSALLSGDRYDSFIDDTFGVGTALFTATMFIVMLATFHLLRTKALVMRLYVLLMGSAIILGTLFLIRLVLGGQSFGLGVLTGTTDNLLGGFNDLALFFGTVVLVSLVAMAQLALTRSGRSFFMIVLVVSLVILAIVNFFIVWLVLGLVSMVLLVYSLTRDHFSTSILDQRIDTNREQSTTVTPILASTVVFIAALLFVIGGTVTGNLVSRFTGITYVEVRPSLQATVDVVRGVYQTDAVFGVGPNRFADAWRLHKDPSLNQTNFWAVDFPYGSGYVTTQFATTGILGGLAWLSFIGMFLWAGSRALFQATPSDRVWYFITTASFVSASFLWLMAFIYTPGSTILLLTALMTGLSLAGVVQLRRTRTYRLSVERGRQIGLMLVGSVMVIMIASVTTLYYIGRHYTAELMYAGAVSGADGSPNLETVEQTIVNAYALVPSGTFARQLALYQLAKMNALLAKSEPTAAEQQEFNKAAVNGINAAKQAIASDPTDPVNYTTHAALLSIMTAAGVAEAVEPAHQLFATARALDPNNPSYLLLEAQLDIRNNDTASARDRLEEAVALKSNYAEALYYLSQLDIADGRVDDAIARTRDIVSIDPQNPARYYQLGVLLSATKQIDEAIAAFEQAVILDPRYANARYFLALGYLESGRTDDAVTQLEIVTTLNPENEFVSGLIEDIKAGKTTSPVDAPETPIEGGTDTETVIKNEDGSVTTTEAPDTSLVSPVNPVESSTE